MKNIIQILSENRINFEYVARNNFQTFFCKYVPLCTNTCNFIDRITVIAGLLDVATKLVNNNPVQSKMIKI